MKMLTPIACDEEQNGFAIAIYTVDIGIVQHQEFKDFQAI